MASLNYLLCATILCTTILINPIGCYGQSKQEQQHKLLFIFGDSLFDPGNNQYLNSSWKMPSNSWPYGMNFHNHSTGRFSDGRLVPDFIAQFANLHMEPPSLEPGANFTDGANFASAGGAVLDDHAADAPMNLGEQMTNFKKVVNSLAQKVGEEEAKKVLMRSVFLFSLGGNDYFSFNTKYPNATRAEQKAYMHMVIGNLTINGIKEIYNMGGRKFGFQNVGPLGCQPGILAMLYSHLKGACANNFLIHANMHNKALSNVLKKKFENLLPGFKYALFDFYHALGDRIKNPTKYGFKEGNVACCGSGLYNAQNCGGGDNGTIAYTLCNNASEYVFFDGAHNTERTNHQLADLLWSGTPDVTGPYNMKQLFELP